MGRCGIRGRWTGCRGGRVAGRRRRWRRGSARRRLGTDTGGSIRQPAAFCGVVGVLPTYGRVSRYGLIAFASSLDRVGPFTATVRDAAVMLGVLAGKDERDATSADRPVDDYVGALAEPVAGLRVGVPEEYFGEGLDEEIRAAIEAALEGLKAAGVRAGEGAAAAYEVRDSDVLRAGDGGGFVEPFAVRWGAVRACGRMEAEDACRRCIGRRARRGLGRR